MRAFIPIVLVSLLAACGGSSGASGSPIVRTSGAEIASLAAYGTYTHATAETSPQGYEPVALRPGLLEEVRAEVDAALQSRGYALVPDGDLVVRISTGRRTVEDQPTGAMAAVGAPETKETEGALVVDILERASGKQVFHGFARDVIHGRAEHEQIVEAVSKIFEPVPRSTSTSIRP